MEHTNSLASQKSPYLLQHAHNPVDWLAWGEEAFALARARDKPIFLSIGYSTCHWCHVMEHESFEDEAVAAFMNQHFVNIKVDREERPDVDRVYMTYVQASTGSGGWPMSVFLTPQLKPFFGGTYFPPSDGYGRVGFGTLLERVSEAWRDDRAKIEASGDHVMDALSGYASLGAAPDASSNGIDWPGIIRKCFDHLRDSFDSAWGGFGDAPKFPRPAQHDFLHALHAASGRPEALAMSRATLRAMARGGMCDQLGGGFHRYSVDARWIVSHFEKMLYDQAQLAVSYLEMYQITGDAFFAAVARATLDYVLRDMTHPEGGFYCAEDADSLPEAGAARKREGAFYVWTAAEIERVLGPGDAAIFNERHGVAAAGNAPAQGDPHGEFAGQNILHQARTVAEVASRFGRGEAEVAAILEAARRKLLAARELRPRPHLDDKIVTAWNGLMISALARAGAVLDDATYLAAARRAADFVLTRLHDSATGRLARHYRDGVAPVAGFADDYAFVARGLLDLFEACFETEYLTWAVALHETMNREFLDPASGAYFNSAPDPSVLLRLREDYDGAEPAASSIAAANGLRLARLTGRQDLSDGARATLAAFGNRLAQVPVAMPELLWAALCDSSAPLHIVIAGGARAADTQALLRAVHSVFLPFKTLVLVDGAARGRELAEGLPFIAGVKPLDGRATAYVCRDFACRNPIGDADQLRAALAGAEKWV